MYVPVLVVLPLAALLLWLFFAVLRGGHGKKGKEFLAALERDPAGARSVLDRLYPPATDVGPLSVVARRQRFAGLAFLGDAKTIEAEMQPLTGPPQFVAQSRAVGWLGIAVAGGVEPAVAATRIDGLTATLDTSKPIMRLIARQISLTAALASAMAGKPVAGASSQNYEEALRDGALSKELSHRAQARAAIIA